MNVNSEHFISENVKPAAKRLSWDLWVLETSWLQIPVFSLMLEQTSAKQSQAGFKLRNLFTYFFSDLEYVQSWKKVIPRCEELQNHFMMTYSLDTCLLVTLGDSQHLQLWRLHLLFWLIILMDSAFLSYIIKWKTVVFFVLVSKSSVFRGLMKFGTAADGYLNYWKA